MNPYQWSFANKVFSKVENIDQKVPKEAEAKRDVIINPQNYNFNHFSTENVMVSKRYDRSRP